MASSKSPSGSVRRQGRNISHPLARRTTRGPLDAGDDPLSEPSRPASPSVNSPVSPVVMSPQALAVHETFSWSRPPARASPSPLPTPSQTELHLSFLLDRGIYHPLPTTDVLDEFLDSSNRPPPGAPLEDLLQGGHFRRAAETAANDLLQCQPGEIDRILQLLHTRLACLVLISRPDLAAQEAFPLIDLVARPAAVTSELVPLIPWGLRVLLVRLQCIGAADGGRRGVMALYALAGEARMKIGLAHEAQDTVARQTWSVRLNELGLRTADTLVEMGELESAIRHLGTLADVEPVQVAYRIALIRLRMGDVSRTDHLIAEHAGLAGGQLARLETLKALALVANSSFDAAADTWRSLEKLDPSSRELHAQNLAVTLLYRGQGISQSRDMLEAICAQGPPFAAAIFNLSTVYELCTERATEHKRALAHRMADKTPTAASEGWERPADDFKL